MKHGLTPRNILEQYSVNYIHNDANRLDGYNAVCLSVMWPNDFLLSRFQKRFPNRKYVVLRFSPQILWEKSCKFFNYNAASSSARGVERECSNPLEAFEVMFAEEINISNSYGSKQFCRDKNEKSFLPTTSQAEVLVGDIIEPAYITEIAVKYSIDEILVRNSIKVSKPEIVVCPDLFLFRGNISWNI